MRFERISTLKSIFHIFILCVLYCLVVCFSLLFFLCLLSVYVVRSCQNVIHRLTGYSLLKLHTSTTTKRLLRTRYDGHVQ